MRKLVFAEISRNDLKTVYSSAVREIQSLAYTNKVFCQKDKIIIQGRDNVKRFVAVLKQEISECRLLFQDKESATEFDSDEKFLDSLLNIKAS